MSLACIMDKRQKKMSKWLILVFAVLIFVVVNVYNHVQENNQYNQEKQSKIDQCNQLYSNQSEASECADYELKRLAFSHDFNERNKPLYPISPILTALILGVILFYLIQFLRNVYD